MAHQAVDLGHIRQGLELAAASMDGKRYLMASPRERALFGVVYARALGASGQQSAAAKARRGEIDQACFTWSTALDAMEGIHSARARQTVVDMRAALSAFRGRGVAAAVELDARACSYLNTGSR
jgi:hypothetical protein